MNKKTHRLFGDTIYRYLDETYGIKLNYHSFLLGNISPDLTFSFVFYPHEREKASAGVRRKIDRLLAPNTQTGMLLSQSLGSLCHYISDFFCEAHTPRYTGSVREHILYEQELYYYCRFHTEEIRKGIQKKPVVLGSADTIFNIIERLNDQYLSGSPTFEAQAVGAVQTCIEVVSSIMAVRQMAMWQPGLMIS